MSSACQYCQARLANKTDFREHLKYAHIREEFYKCDHCNYYSYNQQSFLSHMQTVHPNLTAE
jgi:uncharacterized protein with PIN domain